MEAAMEAASEAIRLEIRLAGWCKANSCLHEVMDTVSKAVHKKLVGQMKRLLG